MYLILHIYLNIYLNNKISNKVNKYGGYVNFKLDENNENNKNNKNNEINENKTSASDKAHINKSKNENSLGLKKIFKKISIEVLFFFIVLLLLRVAPISAALPLNNFQEFQEFQIMSTISNTREILAQIGPILSAVLFIIAGIFYALGQLLPPEKKAQFHTTAINVIIGAIVIAVLSFAATSLATASTHLLSNFTTNSVNSTL